MTAQKTAIFTIILLMIFFVHSSRAGFIDAGLANKISGLDSSDKIPVVIKLKDNNKAAALKTRLVQNYKTRAERHRAGIAELKASSARSQKDLLDLLESMKNSGLAENIKPHWLVDAVEAEITISELNNLADRNDVEVITALPTLKLIEPLEASVSRISGTDAVTDNLKAVGADSAWALGYDGTGSIVCSFDTGVEGLHPALYNSWKGHDGDSLAAWYDPRAQATFPHALVNIAANPYHGTATMGAIVGYDSTTGDYYGVAPGAKWISAAVINVVGVSYLDAWEWAADPDGDPNSISDVPDVINHSWGNDEVGCDYYYLDMIDNSEALGIVNIFAAGNSGSGAMTIVNPAMIARNPLDCFAVGNIDYQDNLIVLSSSRGPSECDGVSIKPNVVAPGQGILTAWYSGGSYTYADQSGTSMAAPHVSGAVAILRQAAPNATVDQIKEALLASCLPLPTPDSTPNNDYGWGLINIPRAIEALVPNAVPDIKVYSFEQNYIDPGDTVSGEVVVVNLGDPVDSLVMIYTGLDETFEVLTDTLNFGMVGTGDTVRSDIAFTASTSDTLTPGQYLKADMEFNGSGGYTEVAYLYIKVGETQEPGYYTHITDSLNFTISNFGQFGFGPGSFIPMGFEGFKFGDKVANDLYEGSFMIGNSAAQISDAVKNLLEDPDNDFAVAPGGELVSHEPGTDSDRETFSIFNDSRAENPIGLEIQQKSYSWDIAPNAEFVVLEYVFKNVTDSSINGLYSGLYMDWDPSYERYNWADYLLDDDFGFLMYNPPDSSFTPVIDSVVDTTYWHIDTTVTYNNTQIRGVSVLNPEGMTGHKLIQWNPAAKDWDMTETEKYDALTYSAYDKNTNGWYDLAQVVATGPFDLGPGGSDTAIFAVIGGRDSADIGAYAAQAKQVYQISTDVAENDITLFPDRFELYQNYPNPFNPTTVIGFSLKARAEVNISVFNILGEKVAELINKELGAGYHMVTWDGRDRAGNEAATGVYFYRLKSDDFKMTRKMLLLK